eukprot:scaffold116722_cov75-Phaeocystis_antarctica.AAC.1
MQQPQLSATARCVRASRPSRSNDQLDPCDMTPRGTAASMTARVPPSRMARGAFSLVLLKNHSIVST